MDTFLKNSFIRNFLGAYPMEQYTKVSKYIMILGIDFVCKFQLNNETLKLSQLRNMAKKVCVNQKELNDQVNQLKKQISSLSKKVEIEQKDEKGQMSPQNALPPHPKTLKQISSQQLQTQQQSHMKQQPPSSTNKQQKKHMNYSYSNKENIKGNNPQPINPCPEWWSSPQNNNISSHQNLKEIGNITAQTQLENSHQKKKQQKADLTPKVTECPAPSLSSQKKVLHNQSRHHLDDREMKDAFNDENIQRLRTSTDSDSKNNQIFHYQLQNQYQQQPQQQSATTSTTKKKHIADSKKQQQPSQNTKNPHFQLQETFSSPKDVQHIISTVKSARNNLDNYHSYANHSHLNNSNSPNNIQQQTNNNGDRTSGAGGQTISNQKGCFTQRSNKDQAQMACNRKRDKNQNNTSNSKGHNFTNNGGSHYNSTNPNAQQKPSQQFVPHYLRNVKSKIKEQVIMDKVMLKKRANHSNNGLSNINNNNSDGENQNYNNQFSDSEYNQQIVSRCVDEDNEENEEQMIEYQKQQYRSNQAEDQKLMQQGYPVSSDQHNFIGMQQSNSDDEHNYQINNQQQQQKCQQYQNQQQIANIASHVRKDTCDLVRQQTITEESNGGGVGNGQHYRFISTICDYDCNADQQNSDQNHTSKAAATALLSDVSSPYFQQQQQLSQQQGQLHQPGFFKELDEDRQQNQQSSQQQQQYFAHNQNGSQTKLNEINSQNISRNHSNIRFVSPKNQNVSHKMEFHYSGDKYSAATEKEAADIEQFQSLQEYQQKPVTVTDDRSGFQNEFRKHQQQMQSQQQQHAFQNNNNNLGCDLSPIDSRQNLLLQQKEIECHDYVKKKDNYYIKAEQSKDCQPKQSSTSQYNLLEIANSFLNSPIMRQFQGTEENQITQYQKLEKNKSLNVSDFDIQKNLVEHGVQRRGYQQQQLQQQQQMEHKLPAKKIQDYLETREEAQNSEREHEQSSMSSTFSAFNPKEDIKGFFHNQFDRKFLEVLPKDVKLQMMTSQVNSSTLSFNAVENSNQQDGFPIEQIQ